MTSHAKEVAAGSRFEFGKNWQRFIEQLDDSRIQAAEGSLKHMLGMEDLVGRSFLDVGSGSGLFSLAARKLGATVTSLDYDPYSFECTRTLRDRYFRDEDDWRVELGSILDDGFVARLGKFDIVYSWGVLHHTGDMYRALSNVASLVAGDGLLFVAIYNDQGRASKYWLKIKQAYNALPGPLRWLVVLPSFVRLWGPTTVRDVLRGMPFDTWRNSQERNARGMDPWRDVIDWVGGLPFEVAKPDESVVDRFIAAVTDAANLPVFIHCGSANRVAGLWMIKRVVADNWDVAKAEAEAREIGLSSPAVRDFALSQIAKRRH